MQLPDFSILPAYLQSCLEVMPELARKNPQHLAHDMTHLDCRKLEIYIFSIMAKLLLNISCPQQPLPAHATTTKNKLNFDLL